MLKKTLVILFVTLALVSGSMFAQQSNSRILGKVTDEEGSGLPGVAVSATSPKLVGKAETITDENGVYRLLNLVPGVYTITYMLEGFQTVVRQGVAISVEQTLELAISLKLGSIEEKITVTGEAPLIDVKSTSKGMTLTKEVFQTLPKGRNFDSLVTAIPGVTNEPMLGGTSVDGASGLENMYYIDGTDTTNIVDGSRGQSASFDFVDEVQVKASGYQAEFGGSLGGVINVVTRSGGNEFHGEILGFYSGAPLRAAYSDRVDYSRDSTDVATTFAYNDYIGENNDTRIEAGFTLGGYIFKDKLWFFGSFLPIFYNNTRTVNYPSGETRDWKRTENYWNFQVKLTAQPLKNLRVSASVVNNFYKYKGNLDSSFGNPDPAISYDEYGTTYPNISASASADMTLGNNFMFSLRGGYFMSNAKDPLVNPYEPCWRFNMGAAGNYTSTTNIGYADIPDAYKRTTGWRNSGYPTALVQALDEKYSVNADLTYFVNLAGEHSWKVGAQFVRQGQDYDQTAIFPIFMLGWDKDLVLYGNDYGRGTYGFVGVRGNADAGPYGDFYKAYANRWALYIQDSWTISNKLTLNFGLRTESEYIPSYSDNPLFADAKPIEWGFGEKLAPRLGFVYDVNGDSSFKIFGSYGLYFDVMKLAMAAGSYGGFKWKTAYYPLNTYEWDKLGVEGGIDLGTPWIVVDYRIPSFDSTDPDMKPMSQQEISIGAEKKLGENLALSFRVVNKHLRWAIEDIGVLTAQGELYYTTNPGGEFIKGVWQESMAAGLIPMGAPDIPKAKREYWGVNVSLDKRFSDNWMGGISYTWSRLTGNYSGLASGDEYGRTDPNVERYFDLWYLAFDKDLNKIDGVMPGDRTHQFKAYGSYTFDFGLTVGAIVNAMSGIPVSTEYAMDVDGYLPFNRGDLGRTPFLMFANLYAEYNLKLGNNTLNFNINIDNLLNTRTAMRVYGRVNQGNIPITDEELLAANWTINDYNWTPDPLYNKKMWFYGDGLRGTPFSVRVGVKYMF